MDGDAGLLRHLRQELVADRVAPVRDMGLSEEDSVGVHDLVLDVLPRPNLLGVQLMDERACYLASPV